MTVCFELKDLETTSIKRLYAHECRNYQFEVPCSLHIRSHGMDGVAVHMKVVKALEGIAWVKGTLKELEIVNLAAENPFAEIIIEELKEC